MSEDGVGDLLLVHGDDFVHVLAHHREGELAGPPHRDAVRDGGARRAAPPRARPRSDAFMLASAAVCTPTTWMRGLVSLSAQAMPEMSPPPPMGTTTISMKGFCSSSSRPMVPWPAMTCGVIEGVDEDEVLLLLDAHGLRVGLVEVGALEHHVARRTRRACATP